jgi:nitroreductase
MIDNMRSRRTIRQYADKDVSNELLDELLSVAARSSNTGNMQLYSVVVTRSQDGKEKLSPAHFDQPMIKGAPVVLTICADANRFVKWASQRKAEAGFDNFQTFVAAAIDATIFAQAFCDAAEASGLGICYLGTTTYNADKIISALRLPRLVVPVITLTVGYPANMPEQPERLPLRAITHTEAYADYTPEMIDELYADKESLETNKKFVEDNGKETLAQVFTDIRYTKANNEYFSKVFEEVLKSQGFA